MVGGYSSNGSNLDFALARYNNNGSLDTTFGIGGKVTTSIGTGDDFIMAMAIDVVGNIVVGGWTSNSNWDFALARFDSNGLLDNSFGSGGIVVTQVGASHDMINSLAIDGLGRIVVAGQSHDGVKYNFAIARYESNGGWTQLLVLGARS